MLPRPVFLHTGKIMKSKNIAVIVGSLRKESFSRKIANALVTLAPESLTLEILEIGELQMYNQDSKKYRLPHGQSFAVV